MPNKELTPTDNYYTGKLIVLIDTYTFFTAESFTLDLKESKTAILIGRPTAGDTGNRPSTFTTQNNNSFRIPTRKPAQISPLGFFMEDTGIQPDHFVEQTIEDYMNDIDTVLEYAISINNL